MLYENLFDRAARENNLGIYVWGRRDRRNLPNAPFSTPCPPAPVKCKKAML